MYRQALTILLAFLMLLFPFSIVGQAAQEDVSVSGAGEAADAATAALSAAADAADQAVSYSQYAATHANTPAGAAPIVLTAADCRANSDVQIASGYEGYADEYKMPLDCVVTGGAGDAEWDFTVPVAGMYRLRVNYYPIEGTSNTIERALLLDGVAPFAEAENLRFERLWGNDGEITADQQGNEMRPSQVETPAWTAKYIQDADGFVGENLRFYLSAGAHTLTLRALREPMAVGDLAWEPAAVLPTYEQVRAAYTYPVYHGKDAVAVIQGEHAQLKSDSTLYATWDRSSALSEPMDYHAIRLNTIGGTAWRMAGQWLEWEMTVPEDGLYRIALRVRQNYTTGIYATRRLTIDGTVPFAEAEQIRVKYSTKWQTIVLGSDSEDYLFQLSAGTHRLRLQVVLGDMGELVERTDDLITRLNQAYREIIVITGTSPDTYRDYYLEKEVPDTMKHLGELSGELEALSEKLTQLTGKNSEQNSLLDRLALQTKQMNEKPRNVAKLLANFKNNLSSLGTWTLNIREQALDVDAITVLADETPTPRAESGFWAGLWHELRLFGAAFTTDYSHIGETDNQDAIEVWVTSGREQAQIIKQMIQREYEDSDNVNVKLVSAGAVLPSILSHDSGDMVIALASTTVMDYAARGALLNLDPYIKNEPLSDSFYESALLPLRYNGSQYALPDSQTFPVVFYRTDIFDELGITVPNTWDELYDVLYVLSQNHMEFGMSPAMSSYAIFLYQNGGSFYLDDDKRSAMSEPTNINAFRTFANLYVNYSLPLAYNFANRFRSGEMPMGIADYSTYNQLIVFAPEIRGLWAFAPMIGTKKADGTIDRTVTGGVSGTAIMKETKRPEQCAKFLLWWTGCDAQVSYAREQESVMGAAARYAVANIQAMDRMAWDTDQLAVLKQQWANVRGIPEVPGGYYTSRYIDFAYKAVVLQDRDAREVLLDYTEIIDREITNKRKEFRLPIYEEVKNP